MSTRPHPHLAGRVFLCYYQFMKYEIVADFDATLTQKGEGLSNSFAALRDVLPPAGQKYSDEIFAYYSPKEFDFSIDAIQRDILMRKWWEEEFGGMAKLSIYREDIKRAAYIPNLKMRDGITELFAFAKSNNIPILIFTAGVADIIEMKLEKEGLLNDNVTIVGNRFIFDNKGLIIGNTKPVIYVGNKHLVAQTWDVKMHADVAFLLGDHPTDAKMCDDNNHEKVIRFGFLNGKSNDDGSYDEYDHLYKEGNDSLKDVLEKIKENFN